MSNMGTCQAWQRPQQSWGARGPLTLGDAVLGGQEALLEEALQHGADGWPMHQLQHEEVRLQREDVVSGGRRGEALCWPTLLSRPMHRWATATPPQGVRSPHPHLLVKLTVCLNQCSTTASLLKHNYSRGP